MGSNSSDSTEPRISDVIQVNTDPGGGVRLRLHDVTSDTHHIKRELQPNIRDSQLQCGMMSCRPSCIQPCASLPFYTVFMSCLGLFGSVNFSHYTAVISQIEKQYGLSSSITGFIKNIDNIGFLITVLIFSHMCRHSNKPRLFAIANIAASIAICCFSLPYFIFGTSDLTLDGGTHQSPNQVVLHPPVNTSLSTYNITQTDKSKYEFCDGKQTTTNEYCDKRRLNIGALVILIAAGLIQGMFRPPAQTLGLTYMDDTSKDASPKYFGFIFGSRSLAPILGFLLGAWTTTMYVDLSDPGITQTDPRWVGAWWIGFLICGAATAIWTLPILMFPVKLPINPTPCRPPHKKVKDRKPNNNDSDSEEKMEMLALNGTAETRSDDVFIDGAVNPAAEMDTGDLMTNIKGLGPALGRLFRNPVFLFSVMGACCNMSMIGFITFLSKFIEMQYRQSPSMSNIYTGCISAFTFSIGPVVSGRIIARFKFSAIQSMKFIVYVQLIAVCGFVSMMFLGCAQPPWAGDPFLNQSSEANWTLSCNLECECDEAEFTPVCGSNGLNYYSPCFAGCTGPGNASDKIFTDCSCIPDGQAELGRCDPSCIFMVPYLLILGVTSFVTSMFIVPLMTVMLRCVEERDKALSIALGTACVNFAAFPAPIIYGLVVDSICLVKQITCGGKGACLFNEPSEMQYWLHGFEAGFKAIGLLCFGLALYNTRKIKFSEDKEVVNFDLPPNEEEKRIVRTSSISV